MSGRGYEGKDGVEGEEPMFDSGLEREGALGGARPEERIGSEDPVKRDAAVAAAATLIS